jgi:hypothetical protein
MKIFLIMILSVILGGCSTLTAWVTPANPAKTAVPKVVRPVKPVPAIPMGPDLPECEPKSTENPSTRKMAASVGGLAVPIIAYTGGTPERNCK